MFRTETEKVLRLPARFREALGKHEGAGPLWDTGMLAKMNEDTEGKKWKLAILSDMRDGSEPRLESLDVITRSPEPATTNSVLREINAVRSMLNLAAKFLKDGKSADEVLDLLDTFDAYNADAVRNEYADEIAAHLETLGHDADEVRDALEKRKEKLWPPPLRLTPGETDARDFDEGRASA